MLSTLSPFLMQLSRSSDGVKAAVADNCRFDERADSQRWEAFATGLPSSDYANLTWEDWAEADALHRQKRLTVPSTSIPDALLEINKLAWLNGLAPEQTLVRLEALEWPLAKLWDMDLDKFDELHRTAKSSPDSSALLSQLLSAWNMQRDNRPLFAAFLDEINDDLESNDWPHQMRDRLGLGH